MCQFYLPSSKAHHQCAPLPILEVRTPTVLAGWGKAEMDPQGSCSGKRRSRDGREDGPGATGGSAEEKDARDDEPEL